MNAGGAPNFNRLARIYRALEYLAFGRDLERTRFHFVRHLSAQGSILVIGEGDGRFLAQLVAIAPSARIHCIDGSPAMLAQASARLSPAQRERVTFTCTNALTHDFGRETYDAVVTLFFLDCLTTVEVRALVGRIAPRLTANARWLFGDFVLPASGWARVRARIWLWFLYLFFRWETGLRVNDLPDSGRQLEASGFVAEATQTFQHGLLRTTLFRN